MLKTSWELQNKAGMFLSSLKELWNLIALFAFNIHVEEVGITYESFMFSL